MGAPSSPSEFPGHNRFDMVDGRVLMRLLGPFAVERADGTDVTPKGKRAKALLALLALSPNWTRSRRWLQDKLWSERPQEQGAASLRQELSAIRRTFHAAGIDILHADRDQLKLDRTSVHLDLDDPSMLAQGEDLLEGLDVRDPEFEDWLRTERSRFDAPEGLDPPLRARPLLRPPTAGITPLAALGGAPPAALLPLEPPGAAHKPYLVVRDFQPIGSSERAVVFAGGLTAELLTVLGSLSGAFVVRRHEGEHDRRRTYELSGEVRNGDRLRITARLVALDTDQCIWSQRFDYPNEASFDAQEAISRKVVEAAQIEISDGEWARIWCDVTTSIEAWELYQKGRALETEARRDSTRRAILTYRAVLDADPEFTPAMISLGFCLVDELRLGWSARAEESLAEAVRLVAEVARRQPRDYFGRALAAFVESVRGNHDRACALMEEVMKDAPESPELLAYYGGLLGYSGKLAEEIRYYEHALSLTRHPPNWIQTNLAFAYLCQDHPDSRRHVEAALAMDPQSVRAHLCRVVVAVRAGALGEARLWAERLLTLEPQFRAERWGAPECFADPQLFHRIAAELSAAGL